MIYTETVSPRFDDMDQRGRLSPEAMLHLLEGVANHQLLLLSDDIVAKSSTGIAWIMTGCSVEIVRQPVGTAPLTVQTWARSAEGSQSSTVREYAACDASGETCLLGSFKTVLYDLHAKTLLRITPELAAQYRPEEKSVLPEPPRLHAPERYDTQTPIAMRRSDIDFYGHVHNANYLNYALQALPQTVYDTVQLRAFHIAFRHSLVVGDCICARYAREDTGAFVGIYNGEDTPCAFVRLEFSA